LDSGFDCANCALEPLQTTSFANRQPVTAFQVLETPIFGPDLCKAALATIRFIRLAPNPALASTCRQLYSNIFFSSVPFSN
jgi:hypothetical protein